MQYTHFFLKYKWEILGAILLLWTVYINLFPKDFIILGGDILQPINMADHFAFYYYEWSGRASLFYGIFYFLDKIGVSDSMQISWYLGIFLLGAYFSFLAFCRLVFPQLLKQVGVLSALFYATNMYTLYVFTATWGYSSYQIIYIFIPVLVGLFLRALESGKSLYIFFFLLVSFFLSMSFGNPAFALSLGIFFIFLIILLLLFRFIEFNKKTSVRIAMMALGAFLLNIYWILPLYPQMQSGIKEIYSSEEVNLTERLQKTSNAISDTIRLLSTSEQNRYFPVNFPYPTISWLEYLIVLLAFIPFFLVLIGYAQKRKGRECKLYVIFFTLTVIFIALVARVRFPFDIVNNFLFQLPGLNTLRGYDKLATFVPFLLSVLLVMFLMAERGKRHFKFLVIFFFIFIVILALPFYIGGIQTKLSYILSNNKSKDFNTARQSALVNIPEEYADAISVLSPDRNNSKVSMLPFSAGSSVGRVDLPALKINGPHFARYYYNKSFVELTEPYIPGWKFADDFENEQYNPQWIADLFGLLGIEYVLYHKDAKPSSMEKMEPARVYLESIGAFHRILNNDSFILYQVDKNRLFPYVYGVAAKDIFIQADPETISEKAQAIHSSILEVGYSVENPKEIAIRVDTLMEASHIFLNQKKDSLWVAQYVAPDGTRSFLEKDDSVTYANAWKIEKKFTSGSIRVYYSPITLFFLGKTISGITLVLVVLGVIYTARKR